MHRIHTLNPAWNYVCVVVLRPKCMCCSLCNILEGRKIRWNECKSPCMYTTHTHTHTNCVTSRWIRFAFVNILPHETNNSNRNNNSLALLGVEASFILGKSGWLERMTIIIMFVWTWTSAYASCTLSVKRNSIWKAAKAKQRASMNYFLRMKILK